MQKIYAETPIFFKRLFENTLFEKICLKGLTEIDNIFV